ncbi:hypothetical protein CRENBAI_007164 [Crenichthys baileyi]|uniref:Uncharacterized protein n=1 Tax=Crenichthys baileyi TaxID=28760 RepID=A0AAV9RMZ9_9TELE
MTAYHVVNADNWQIAFKLVNFEHLMEHCLFSDLPFIQFFKLFFFFAVLVAFIFLLSASELRGGEETIGAGTQTCDSLHRGLRPLNTGFVFYPCATAAPQPIIQFSHTLKLMSWAERLFIGDAVN